MQHIFMDESGTLGFSGNGTKYFVLAFVAPKQGKQLNKCIKNFNAHLIRNGWNPDVEIKATNLWHAPKSQAIDAAYKYKNDPAKPIKYILTDLAKLQGKIEYVVIRLDTVAHNIRNAPYGILYNYFSWQLLRGPLTYFNDIGLTVDRRNRESHNLQKFDNYIEGQAFAERAEKDKTPLSLNIKHLHWKSADEFKAEERALIEFGVRGLEAADFICWAIKKKYENNEDEWYSLIENRINWSQHLYWKPMAVSAGQ